MSESTDLLAVVFDMDGLMLNTEWLYQQVGTELLRRRGKPFEPELLDQMMGRRSPVALQMMIDWHGLADTVETLRGESKQIYSAIIETQLEQMPGLLELLAALETAALPKAIATSSGRQFTETVLSRFDLAPRFAFILTGDDVVEGKPHPEVYLRAAERLAIEPRRMMVLEDSQIGCRAAVAAGAFAVAVPAGHSRSHDFSGTAFVAESLGDSRIYAALRLAIATGKIAGNERK